MEGYTKNSNYFDQAADKIRNIVNIIRGAYMGSGVDMNMFVDPSKVVLIEEHHTSASDNYWIYFVGGMVMRVKREKKNVGGKEIISVDYDIYSLNQCSCGDG